LWSEDAAYFNGYFGWKRLPPPSVCPDCGERKTGFENVVLEWVYEKRKRRFWFGFERRAQLVEMKG